MEGYIEICAERDVPKTEPLIVEVDGTPIAICRVGDNFFALEDVCPHQGASFEGGEIEDGILTCPLHGWRMNIATGQSLEAATLRNKTYDVKVEGGKIFLKLA